MIVFFVFVFDGKVFVVQLSIVFGVYCMYVVDDMLLYVGKVCVLCNCVGSYFNGMFKFMWIMLMLLQVVWMDVIVMCLEVEVLLLENQLIKLLLLCYNVFLCDDKIYLYVLLIREDWLCIVLYCGLCVVLGCYYGLYLGVIVVCDIFNLMYKLFKLCSCEDSVFCNCLWFCL